MAEDLTGLTQDFEVEAGAGEPPDGLVSPELSADEVSAFVMEQLQNGQEPAQQPAAAPGPQSPPGEQLSQFPEQPIAQFGMDASGNLTGLNDGQQPGVVPWEAYDRVKKGRDNVQQQLDDWQPVIDLAKQFGATGSEALRNLQFQQARQGQPMGNDYSEFDGRGQAPNAPMTLPQSGDPTVRDLVREIREEREQRQLQAGVEQIKRTTVAALQKLGLHSDRMAFEFLQGRMARGDQRPPEDILRDYIGLRSQSMAGAQALKQEAARLTPDARGGHVAPGTAKAPPNLAGLTPDQQKRAAIAAFTQYNRTPDGGLDI